MRRNSDFPEPVVPPTSTCGPSRPRSIGWMPCGPTPTAAAGAASPPPRADAAAHPVDQRVGSDAAGGQDLLEAHLVRHRADPEPVVGPGAAQRRQRSGQPFRPPHPDAVGHQPAPVAADPDSSRACPLPAPVSRTDPARPGKGAAVPCRDDDEPARRSAPRTPSRRAGRVPRARHDEDADGRGTTPRRAARDGTVRAGGRPWGSQLVHDHSAATRRPPRQPRRRVGRAQLAHERAQHGVRHVVRTHDAEALDVPERSTVTGVAARTGGCGSRPRARRPASGPRRCPAARPAVVACPEARHPVLDGREHRLWVGVAAVEARPLVGQRSGELVARPLHGRCVGSGVASGGPTRTPPVAERGGEEHDRAEQREDEQLRPEEQCQARRPPGRDERSEPGHACAVPLGRRCGTGDLDDLPLAHRARRLAWATVSRPSPRRWPRGRAAVADGAAGSTCPRRRTDGGVHRRRPGRWVRPSTMTPFVEPRSSTTTPDASTGRAHGPATAPRRAAPARMPVPVPTTSAGGESAWVRPASGPPTTARWSSARRRLGPAGLADGDRRAVDERRQAERRHPTGPRGPGWTGEPTGSPRCSASAAQRSRAVCRPDQRTRTSTGRGRRRGRCTVSVISMAATVGTRTDGGRQVIHRRRRSGCEIRAARVR